MPNPFMLAPMTNTQSHDDGSLSDDELHWLTMRAKGQFGMVMTCASHVQAVGKGFPGQLGIFSDALCEGHGRLVANIKAHGSLAVIQLHHAGMRSPKVLIGEAPHCPSDNEKHGARGLTLAEVQRLRDDFICAAVRAKSCGYDGVEVHGAHGYIITQFLSSETNHRTDGYGGPLENRARLLFEVIDGIRSQCGSDFLLGVRLSPERFGMQLDEVKQLCKQFVEEDLIDFLDISLWDCFKLPEDQTQGDRNLLGHFTDIDYGRVKWGVAGKIMTGADVHHVLQAGADFVVVGRAAILHHDFPKLVMSDPDFTSEPTPVSAEYLHNEGLGEAFIRYMRGWPDFVKKQ